MGWARSQGPRHAARRSAGCAACLVHRAPTPCRAHAHTHTRTHRGQAEGTNLCAALTRLRGAGSPCLHARTASCHPCETVPLTCAPSRCCRNPRGGAWLGDRVHAPPPCPRGHHTQAHKVHTDKHMSMKQTAGRAGRRGGRVRALPGGAPRARRQARQGRNCSGPQGQWRRRGGRRPAAQRRATDEYARCTQQERVQEQQGRQGCGRGAAGERQLACVAPWALGFRIVGRPARHPWGYLF